MKRQSVEIIESHMLNHNVKAFRTERPRGFEFDPGQATELSLPNEKDLADEKRPFTFTSLPADPWLEFTIKTYPDHNGVTDRLRSYERGDVFEIGEAWGAIKYQGPGLFLAGGAGITPFLSILRSLKESHDLTECGLWFSNRTKQDIFLKDELQALLDDRLRLILTDEEGSSETAGRIDREQLKTHVSDFGQNFYICGPDPMVKDLSDSLELLDVPESRIVTEDLG